MRIVSWNLNHDRRSPQKRQQAWDYLRDVLRADVALVQEAAPKGFKQVYRPIGDRDRAYEWGSAVVVLRPHLVLREYQRVLVNDRYMTPPALGELPDSHPGACAVADVSDANGRHLLTAISLYGQFEGMPGEKYWDSTSRLHRMLSDLTSVLARSARRSLVLAGDWNIGTQAFSPAARADAEAGAAAFARLRAWGLIDCIGHTSGTRPKLRGCKCLEGPACTHVQTYRRGNKVDSPPTQLDYVFGSKPVVSRLRSCTVVHAEEAWALSDHCPIVLELAD